MAINFGSLVGLNLAEAMTDRIAFDLRPGKSAGGLCGLLVTSFYLAKGVLMRTYRYEEMRLRLSLFAFATMAWDIRRDRS